MGSKSRIVSEIAPIIQKYVDKSESKVYFEPFCGGCNVIDHIKAYARIAADNQKYLIALYKNLHRLCELPDFVTKEHYDSVRRCYNTGGDEYEDWYIGAIGFLASYNGRFFDGGYAGIRRTKIGTERNYYSEAKRNLEVQVPNLAGIEFYCFDYRNINGINGCVVYCDPPYSGTKKYSSSKNFNHDEFWAWVRKMSENNIVIVSEQSAPEDFECIWEQQVTRMIDYTKRVRATEKLFIMKKDGEL